MIPIRDTQPSYTKPVVTVIIIVVNLAIYLHEFSLQLVDPYALNVFIAKYALRPAYFHPITLLTSMFLHGGWMHVLGNMLFLWVFGDNIEDILGHWKYLIFYLVCGIAAGMAQLLIDPTSRVPMLGASGAIAGVMGAYLAKFPHARVIMLTWLLFIFTFELPAWAMLIYWFALQLFGGYGSLSSTTQGGTAFFAHIGGFIVGIALIFAIGTRQRYQRRRDVYWE
jgi:membrane associated rhomboid family serine protease